MYSAQVCNNKKHLEICKKYSYNIPFCDNTPGKISEGPYIDPPGENSLILSFFNLRKILLHKKNMQFRAKGICMYPLLRPCDRLHIISKELSEIAIGDVIVYRQGNSLFAHRAIRRAIINGHSAIIIRSDRNFRAREYAVCDEDILGIVSFVERKGKKLSIDEAQMGRVMRAWYNILFACYSVKEFFLIRITNALPYLQQLRLYRVFAKSFFLKPKGAINFSLQIPFNPHLPVSLHKTVSEEALVQYPSACEGDSILRFQIIMRSGSRSIAFFSFMLRPHTCFSPGCWMSDARFMLRYRWTGIESSLKSEIARLLRMMGIRTVFSCLRPHDVSRGGILEMFSFAKMKEGADCFFGNPDQGEIYYLKLGG